ncbi:hypothetical protein BBP40_009533 [Aspergillus hancockii]|nr:hypothetical protein BBP40_009533 [Aspergillus hancockii]
MPFTLWWFNDSSRKVRTVLLISIKAPPPRGDHSKVVGGKSGPPTTQQVFMTQEIKMASARIVGAPLVLHFEAFLDQPRQGRETDIVLDTSEIRDCATCI